MTIPNKESVTVTSITNNNATEELYHTNLLRLQVKQLLSESILHLSSQTGLLEKEVKWTKDVHEYIDIVQCTIGNMNATTLSPDDVVMLKKKGNDNNIDDDDSDNKINSGKNEKFWIHLHSDKARKHLKNKDEKDHEWKIHFQGGKSLQMTSVNSYAANGAGLTTTVANANVIPTVDLAVLIPVNSRNNNDNEDDNSEGMIGGKDYLNGRYFDKRNILAIHVAKVLSQKKHRKQIGSVHVVNELDGDFRKVSLILTPPLSDDKLVDKQPSKKKVKKDESYVKPQKNKKKKIRFRLRLVFGVQYDTTLRNTVENNTGWIPSARLFPNRCNNKIIHLPMNEEMINNHGTPNYNNALSADMHHISTTNIIASVSSSALKPFTDTLVLLKIWCLQRGFLRGHDTFSEKVLALTLAYLYRSKLVSSRMDSVQVFTVWMKFISDKDWLGETVGKSKKVQSDVNKDTIRHSSSQGYQDLCISDTPGKKIRAAIVMPETDMSEQETILNCVQNRLHASDMKSTMNNKNQDEPKTLLESFKVNTDSPIFLDPTMTENYFGNLSPCFIREVQFEAKIALQCIHYHGDGSSSRIDPFRQLFLEQQRFWKRYDAYIKLDINDIVFPPNSGSKTRHEEMTFWGDNVQDLGNYEAISRGLAKVLKMGLGDRVTSLRLLTNGNGETSLYTNNAVTDVGTSPIVNSDQVGCMPIRSTQESHFKGFSLDTIESPVVDGLSKTKGITVGLRINPDTCHRIVDRGPPADDISSSSAFVSLWGGKKAQLRRFKDGAIVHAVIWNDIENDVKKGRVQLESGIKTGDIVERVTRHIFRKHFCRHDIEELPCPLFTLNNITSLVECAQDDTNVSQNRGSEKLHKNVMTAYDALVSFLRKNSELSSTPSGGKTSKLGLPLQIDAVEALSSCLRYSEVFPPIPHPSLGIRSDKVSGKKVAGAIVYDPVLIQIRFEVSGKWPQDINAMGAAKCAMLTQLAEGIEKMKNGGDSSCDLFDGPINVMPTYLDLGYSGYNFRIIVRADEELKMLQSLRNPTQEAVTMKQVLRKRHILSSMHHFMIHGVHTKYPSSSTVVRLLKRWLSAHMLSDLIPGEAVELIVASVFTDPAPFQTPSTVVCGFMRSLQLLSSHDWARNALIVDPENHIDVDARSNILAIFEQIRGPEYKNGPPMFVISPTDFNEHDNTWKPSFTAHSPEKVVLMRVCALAKRSYDYLMGLLIRSNSDSSNDSNKWTAIFQESSNSLKSYSALLRVDRDLIFDTDCGSTSADLNVTVVSDKIITPFARSSENRFLGPKRLRKKRYKNLVSTEQNIMYSWNPINEAVSKLRLELGHLAVFFYNEYTPDVIGCLWRPDIFKGQPFSAMYSEYKRPIDLKWSENSLVITNSDDVMRVVQFFVRNVVVDIKILDDRSMKIEEGTNKKSNSKRKISSEDSDDDESSDSDDE